jgi:hypothetical protein
MKKFEYYSVWYSGEVTQDTLNVYGDDGWELVSVVASTIYTDCYLYVFKREKYIGKLIYPKIK